MSDFTSDDGDYGWSSEYARFRPRFVDGIDLTFEAFDPELKGLLFGVDQGEPFSGQRRRRKIRLEYANGRTVEFDADVDHVSPIDRVGECFSYSFTANNVNNVVYRNVRQLVTPPEPIPYWCSWRGLLWDEPIRRVKEWWGNHGC